MKGFTDSLCGLCVPDLAFEGMTDSETGLLVTGTAGFTSRVFLPFTFSGLEGRLFPGSCTPTNN